MKTPPVVHSQVQRKDRGLAAETGLGVGPIVAGPPQVEGESRSSEVAQVGTQAPSCKAGWMKRFGLAMGSRAVGGGGDSGGGSVS